MKANPIADRNTISGKCARSAGQSRLRCGQTNGNRIRKVPNQRIVVSVIGGTWLPTWRASTIFPAQNSAVRLSSR